MTGGICYRSGYERGAWFELKSIREVITGKESAGKDATFERKLYGSWCKAPDFAEGDKENLARGIYKPWTVVAEGQGSVAKLPDKELLPPVVMQHSKHGGGRPPKAPGEPVHRATAWRRAKESQGVML
ncbi:MAG: hypothetical protein Q8O55_02350 [Dehalococcoidales bacterium]|nr:hypothetical protein [Dehalococcoidales bacterium]